MNEYLVVGAAGLFAASRNRSYRENVVRTLRTLVDFLQENELTNREILASEEPVTEGLQIMSTDLTETGLETMKLGLDKWLTAQDRGKDVSDVSILLKALDKARS